MPDKIQKYKNDFIFVLNEIKQIALNRNFETVVIKANMFFLEVENWTIRSTPDEMELMKNNLINLIDDLLLVIKTEMRFILFPLPDIKKETYDIGKKFMSNFLEWLHSVDNYTPEKIMSILEEEIYQLNLARENLLKITF